MINYAAYTSRYLYHTYKEQVQLHINKKYEYEAKMWEDTVAARQTDTSVICNSEKTFEIQDETEAREKRERENERISRVRRKKMQCKEVNRREDMQEERM